MRQGNATQSAAVSDGRLIASGSRNELALIQQGENLLIDASLLHRRLGSSGRFRDWITYRLREYGFEEGKDYFAEKVRGNRGRSGVSYFLTLDTAKELAMVEKTEVGREIRRYFIEAEKAARGVSTLPPAREAFKGLKRRRLNDRTLLPYIEVLQRAGYSTHSSGHRRQKYWMHFVKEGTKLWVTEEFAQHLFHQRQVMNNRAALAAMQPVLPLGFGDASLLNPAQP